MNCLHENGLKVSPSKFAFCQKSVKFLGHIISENGIETDPEKVKCIKNWPKPLLMKELSRFIGFVNYYRKFVPNFSKIIFPLEAASDKAKNMRQTRVKWNEQMENSFESVKKSLCTTAILHCPDPNKTFILDTDASKCGIGGVLSQIDEDGTEKVIYFASNKLSKVEENYCATRKELLAVIKYVEFFYHYLVGKRFIVRTDHRSLKWLLTWKTPTTPQYFSWIYRLQQYDFEIVHREGKNHGNADALSRMDYCRQCKTDHQIQVNTLAKSKQMIKDEVEIVKECLIANCSPSKSSSNEVFELWKIKNRFTVDSNKLLLKENGIFRLVISQQTAHSIIQQTHKSACHIGANRLYTAMSRNYYCVGLKKICLEVVGSCYICLERKVAHSKKVDPGNLSCSNTFQKIYIDVAGPLPDSVGHKYILVFVDGFSSFVSLVPIKNIIGAVIAESFLHHWICLFGPPQSIHSDNAKYFSSPELKELCDRFSIQHSFSSPFYPQGNGKVERTIYTMKDMIYCAVKKKEKTWSKILWEVEMCLRSVINPSTGLSPYEVVFGKSINTKKGFTFSFKEITNKQLNKLAKQGGCKIQEDIINVKDIRPGDKVMIRVLPKEKSILKPRYEGPYEVKNVKGAGNAVVVENRFGRQIVRNRSHVKLVRYESERKSKVEKKRHYQRKSLDTSSVRMQTSDTHNAEETTPRYPSRNRIPVNRYMLNSS